MRKITVFLCAAAFILGGCAGKGGARKKGKDNAFAEVVSVSTAAPTGYPELDIRGDVFSSIPELVPIYFDYDRYSLKKAERETLLKNAELLKSHPDIEAIVEGNCDDRGTVEYNLALGQRRAKSVRDYYIRLGVPGENIGSISYGEEQTICFRQTDECWGKNRRADTKVRRKSGTGPSTETEIP